MKSQADNLDCFMESTEDERRDFMKTYTKEIAALENRFTQPTKTKRSVSHERE